MKTFDPREKRILALVNPAEFQVQSLSSAGIQKFLDGIGLRIVDSKHQGDVRSFILSESSLFVAPQALLAVTCGQAEPECILNEIYRIIPPAALLAVQSEVRFSAARNLLTIESDNQWQRHPPLDIPGIVRMETLVRREQTSWTSARALLKGPMGAGAFAATCREIRRVVPALIPDAVTHQHLFTPTGFSMNFFSNTSYGCTHLSPGAEGYLSIEVTKISDPPFLEFSALLRECFPKLSGWVLQEGSGRLTNFTQLHAALDPKQTTGTNA